jgi:hypothetical protein
MKADMSELDLTPSPAKTSSVSRRDALRLGAAGAVAAWSVPVILTLQASPAGAASAPPSNTTSPTTPHVQPPEPPPPGPPGPPAPPEQPEQTTPTGNKQVSPETATTSAQQQPPVPVPRAEVTTTTLTDVRGTVEEAAPGPATTTNNGGLAFTGAEIGGLVVLGTGAIALGTAAVWSARHRDEDDDISPVG